MQQELASIVGTKVALVIKRAGDRQLVYEKQ